MQMVQAAINALRAHNEDEKDPEDAATYSKVISTLRSCIAKHAKEKDQAMGMGPKEKHMRRMSA